MLFISLIEWMICALGIWFIGFRITDSSLGGLIGSTLNFDFFNSVPDERALNYITLFACANFASAITTGALAERTYMDTQIAFKIMFNVLIFPIVASWVYGDGFLKRLGFEDYGGSLVIHVLGGICGFIGCLQLGPRLGLYNDSLPQQDTRYKEKRFKL